jgi:hypothetical protein
VPKSLILGASIETQNKQLGLGPSRVLPVSQNLQISVCSAWAVRSSSRVRPTATLGSEHKAERCPVHAGGRGFESRRSRQSLPTGLKINGLPMITPAQRHSTRLLQRRYLATGSLTDKAQPRHTASDSVLPVVLAMWPGRPDCANSLNSQPAGR